MSLILWKSAITDRNQSDVDKVKELHNKGWDNLTNVEKSEWLAGIKGAFNISDIERLENNIKLMSDVLELDLTTYYGNIPEHPTITYFNLLVSNIQAIRSAYAIHEDTPLTPNTPINSYQKVNDIEKILDDVYHILLNNFNYYCGSEIYAGDTIGLLL